MALQLSLVCVHVNALQRRQPATVASLRVCSVNNHGGDLHVNELAALTSLLAQLTSKLRLQEVFSV